MIIFGIVGLCIVIFSLWQYLYTFSNWWLVIMFTTFILMVVILYIYTGGKV